MRAAVLLAMLALPLSAFAASAQSKAEAQGGASRAVIVRFPDGGCMQVAENFLAQAKAKGGEVVSKAYQWSDKALHEKRSELKANGTCK